MKAQLSAAAPPRLIVLDPDGEYGEHGALHERLDDLYRSTVAPTFQTRFRSSADRATAERQFDFVCRVVRWHVDPQPDQVRPPLVAPVVFVVDELADFVGPSFRESPHSWQWIIRRGRKYGVRLLAASQRPEQIDKSLFSLASRIRCGRLNDPSAHTRLAGAMNVRPADLAALIGHDWIERDKVTGQLRKGS